MHMVLQSIGQAAVLSALEMGIRDFVLIGNLTQLPQCRPVFDTIAQMYDVRFIIPANAEYQTCFYWGILCFRYFCRRMSAIR